MRPLAEHYGVGAGGSGMEGVGGPVRGRLRWLRQFVIEHDWHNNRVIGRPLRWLGRYLP